MGLLLDKFTSLYESWALSDKFMLKAVVLHDPADETTKRFLTENFEKLSGATGDKMLFVSFVDPKRRDLPLSFDPESGRRRLAFERGWDDECLITMAMDLLNVPHAQLPFIALTTSLEDDRFYHIGSSSQEIVPQLRAISRFCNDVDERIDIRDERLQELTRSLGGNTTLRKAICPIGKGLGSLLAPAKSWSDNIAREATREMDGLLDRLSKTELKDNYGLWKQKCQERGERRLEREMEDEDEPIRRSRMGLQYKLDDWDLPVHDLGMRLVTAQDAPRPQRMDDMSYDESNCMVTSRCGWDNKMSIFLPKRILDKCEINTRREYVFYNIAVKSYNLDKAYRQFRDNPESAEAQYGANGLVDYRTPVIKLGLIMEDEMNYSVVQAMRNVMGIDMPEYYHKWSHNNGKVAFSFGTNGEIGLNRFRDENGIYMLQHLTLGEINNGLKYMPERYPDMNLFNDQQSVCENLSTFTSLRNKAAHTYGTCNFQDLFEARTCLMRVLGENITKMLSIKEDLRSPRADNRPVA